MKKATFIILVVLGAVLLWPADSLASNPSPDITPQYRYLQDNDIRFERISVEGGLSQSTVTCIIQDHQGYMWFGTRDGLNKYNGYEFEIFDHDPENLLSLSDNTVRVIFEDYQGVLWVGTNHGLNRFDSRTGLFNSYIYFKDIGNNTIRDNFEDRIGVLWIGTDTGLFYYDRSTNRFHSIEMIKPSDGLSAKLVLSVHEDRMGTLWIGTFQDGLNRYDRETFKFTHYRKSDGLPSDVVYGILGDDLGFLWLSTSRGLAGFDPQTELFTTFDVTGGLQNNEFSEGAYHKNAAGELYFGGISGLTAFDPEGITDNAYIPPIVLTSLTQGGEPVLLDQPGDVINEVAFSWLKNFFEFAALSYQHPEDNQYAYILEGFEDEWNTIGTKRFGRYTNLPGGRYTLNGPGFDLENLPPESLGLGIMKERAEVVGAELEIESQAGQAGQGTEVIVTWQS